LIRQYKDAECQINLPSIILTKIIDIYMKNKIQLIENQLFVTQKRCYFYKNRNDLGVYFYEKTGKIK